MITRANIGDELANLGECATNFGDWHYVLAFNFALVAIASDSFERGHWHGYADGLWDGPPRHYSVNVEWTPGCGKEAT